MIVYHYIITILFDWDEQQSMVTLTGLFGFEGDDEPPEDVLYHQILDQVQFQCRATSLGTDSEIPDRADAFVMFYRCVPNE
jgi:hypothetical protein